MFMRLDPADIIILERLQEDGRSSFREVAKVAGVTTPTVSSKVSTLTNLQLIKGISADIDAEMLNEITALMTIEAKPSDINSLVERFEAFEEVRELYVVDGNELSIKFTTIDMAHLNRFLEEISSVEEIQRYSYKMITRTVKERPRAILSDDLNLTVSCFYCQKQIQDNPVKLKMDGKDHYLCCNSCKTLYVEKYDRIMEGAVFDHPHSH
jgi:DNA-binding Lrp family transcriptional regulator